MPGKSEEYKYPLSLFDLTLLESGDFIRNIPLPILLEDFLAKTDPQTRKRINKKIKKLFAPVFVAHCAETSVDTDLTEREIIIILNLSYSPFFLQAFLHETNSIRFAVKGEKFLASTAEQKNQKSSILSVLLKEVKRLNISF